MPFFLSHPTFNPSENSVSFTLKIYWIQLLLTVSTATTLVQTTSLSWIVFNSFLSGFPSLPFPHVVYAQYSNYRDPVKIRLTIYQIMSFLCLNLSNRFSSDSEYELEVPSDGLLGPTQVAQSPPWHLLVSWFTLASLLFFTPPGASGGSASPGGLPWATR